jgi:hypothetical protein
MILLTRHQSQQESVQSVKVGLLLLTAIFFLSSGVASAAFLSQRQTHRRDQTVYAVGKNQMHRKQFLRHAAIATAVCTSILPNYVSALSFVASNSVTGDTRSFKPNNDDSSSAVTSSSVAYRSLKVDISQGVEQVSVPVAMWFPIKNNVSVSSSSVAKYSHRISVKKIGQLLAGWEFIPEFASKDFSLSPTLSSDTTGLVVSGENMELPTRGPVVLLAHGYLGSRFDLSHLAEALASQGTNHLYE